MIIILCSAGFDRSAGLMLFKTNISTFEYAIVKYAGKFYVYRDWRLFYVSYDFGDATWALFRDGRNSVY